MSCEYTMGALCIESSFIYLHCAVVDRKHVTWNQQALKFMITA